MTWRTWLVEPKILQILEVTRSCLKLFKTQNKTSFVVFQGLNTVTIPLICTRYNGKNLICILFFYLDNFGRQEEVIFIPMWFHFLLLTKDKDAKRVKYLSCNLVVVTTFWRNLNLYQNICLCREGVSIGLLGRESLLFTSDNGRLMDSCTCFQECYCGHA